MKIIENKTNMVTHAGQVCPVSGIEPPLLQTGAEHIVAQLASPRFVHRAEKDGVVTKVTKNKTIEVKYNDGSSAVLDIVPRLSMTKRGAYVLLEMNSIEEGSKIKANQVISATKNFSKDGTYCSGKNVFLAMFNYLGYCHEDKYCPNY